MKNAGYLLSEMQEFLLNLRTPCIYLESNIMQITIHISLRLCTEGEQRRTLERGSGWRDWKDDDKQTREVSGFLTVCIAICNVINGNDDDRGNRTISRAAYRGDKSADLAGTRSSVVDDECMLRAGMYGSLYICIIYLLWFARDESLATQVGR